MKNQRKQRSDFGISKVCCNPEHLFLGTPATNAADKMKKQRHFFPSGELAHWSKLTWEAVKEIRATKIAYGTVSKLAKTFGVSRRAIRFVLKGETWSA